MLKTPILSKAMAIAIHEELLGKGLPPENRLLIAYYNDDVVSDTGLFIAEKGSDTIPKKGVVIQKGFMDSDCESYDKTISIGDVINYGLYAGKEIELDLGETLNEKTKKFAFSVLSVTEVIYIQVNHNK